VALSYRRPGEDAAASLSLPHSASLPPHGS
jgi:hypothetical protein